MASAADIECLKWNNSDLKPSDLLLSRVNHSLALKPSCCQCMKTKGRTTKVAFLGRSNKLVSIDNLNNICVFDWTQRNNIRTLKSKCAYSCKVTGLTTNTSGNQFVTCTDNGKIQLWNFKFSYCEMSTEFKGHYQPVRNVQYSADNNYLISSSNDKTFKIWDFHSTKFVASNMFHRNWVNDAKFFHNDQLVVSCSRDSCVQVFDCCSGKSVAKFSLNPDYAETLALREEFSIAVGTDKGSVQVFDLRVLKVVQKFNEHSSQITNVKFQPDTPCLVSVSKDKRLNVYDTIEGRFLYSLDHFNEIGSMDISLDGQLLATTSFHFNNEICLWESATVDF